MSIYHHWLSESKIQKLKLDGVREHVENFPVYLSAQRDSGRETIVAFNENGNDTVVLDLLDLVAWLRTNPPELTGPGNINDIGVREYNEGFPVRLVMDQDANVPVLEALNQGGNNCVHIDLEQLVDWLRFNRQGLFEAQGD